MLLLKDYPWIDPPIKLDYGYNVAYVGHLRQLAPAQIQETREERLHQLEQHLDRRLSHYRGGQNPDWA